MEIDPLEPLGLSVDPEPAPEDPDIEINEMFSRLGIDISDAPSSDEEAEEEEEEMPDQEASAPSQAAAPSQVTPSQRTNNVMRVPAPTAASSRSGEHDMSTRGRVCPSCDYVVCFTCRTGQ
eukprot:TRINITY_DN268_c0_g1_i7.p3 TRINITY_DN268_c0_g1~~TRINITY_DN268_c0_g1_i7.p3  ORF type:complete len:121 (+),score=34.71 TRINITY_DN268_c0_g1_i7:643-1005(+)